MGRKRNTSPNWRHIVNSIHERTVPTEDPQTLAAQQRVDARKKVLIRAITVAVTIAAVLLILLLWLHFGNDNAPTKQSLMTCPAPQCRLQIKEPDGLEVYFTWRTEDDGRPRLLEVVRIETSNGRRTTYRRQPDALMERLFYAVIATATRLGEKPTPHPATISQRYKDRYWIDCVANGQKRGFRSCDRDPLLGFLRF